MSYYRFKDDDGEEYGSFEVFYRTARAIVADVKLGAEQWADSDGEPLTEGWYWWACFPGCLPDGDPCGPFETEQAAVDDAQDGG